jgi:hypothetical protein
LPAPESPVITNGPLNVALLIIHALRHEVHALEKTTFILDPSLR